MSKYTHWFNVQYLFFSTCQPHTHTVQLLSTNVPTEMRKWSFCTTQKQTKGCPSMQKYVFPPHKLIVCFRFSVSAMAAAVFCDVSAHCTNLRLMFRLPLYFTVKVGTWVLEERSEQMMSSCKVITKHICSIHLSSTHGSLSWNLTKHAPTTGEEKTFSSTSKRHWGLKPGLSFKDVIYCQYVLARFKRWAGIRKCKLKIFLIK